MKKLLFILLSSCLLFNSCTKEESHENESILGCTDENAVNYEEEATEDDGSCLYDSDGDGVLDNDEISGCTDPEADNYNPEATEDDGSCFYSVPTADFTYSIKNDFAPSLVIFENHSTNGVSFNWDFGNGENSTLENPEHLYQGGEYTVTLTVTGLDNQEISYSQSININHMPNELYLKRIRINDMPTTNNGDEWDIGLLDFIHPDVFYILTQEGQDIISSNSIDNVENSDLPIEFIENLPFQISVSDFNDEYSINLWDNDMIQGLGSNELIGSCPFIPANYMPLTGDEDYPSYIYMNHDGIEMQLEIEWEFIF